MLRVADHYAGTDTGRQRRANEDSLLARSPLFVVADGMGGAQAGEVASRIAVDYFREGLEDDATPASALAAIALAANSRIHELSHSSAEHAGMGTTLTAVYVGDQEVAIAHVGDSRAYCLRDGELLRLTDDHSLVDELMRQGRLTPEEAVEHPQRSVITRALGPEGTVEVDTRSFTARSGDVYLLCSDGLTTMLSEEQIAEVLRTHPRLRDAGEALIGAANEAGGRDNITVVLLRLEDVAAGTPPAADGAAPDEHATMTGLPAVTPPPAPRRPRRPEADSGRSAAARRKRTRRVGALAVVLVLLGLIGSGAYLAQQSVYFIGTNNRGLVTLYQGVPFELPGNLALYSSRYVSGVSASTLTPQRRQTLLDHALRSESNAGGLVHSLELGQLE
ncbi:MAG TPA: Stp1/IreP family PP2C-type Ser/Thr phosphatase [Solirubrobacteraceae bacterium]|nr:Stp1/IreP family PP2C-type Ser/Thr phosphatase [Solirubrobacteraceae bacterium]